MRGLIGKLRRALNRSVKRKGVGVSTTMFRRSRSARNRSSLWTFSEHNLNGSRNGWDINRGLYERGNGALARFIDREAASRADFVHYYTRVTRFADDCRDPVNPVQFYSMCLRIVDIRVRVGLDKSPVFVYRIFLERISLFRGISIKLSHRLIDIILIIKYIIYIFMCIIFILF